jgi:hypothetical protein
MTGPDRRSLGQLAYENYVRTAGVGGRVLGWGAIEPSTRAYWEACVRNEIDKRAQHYFAVVHGKNSKHWHQLSQDNQVSWRINARDRLKTELIVAAQNEEAYTWAKNH